MSTGLELVDVEGRHPSEEETYVDPEEQGEQMEAPEK